jgi:hypothetical protein
MICAWATIAHNKFAWFVADKAVLKLLLAILFLIEYSSSYNSISISLPAIDCTSTY